MVRCAQCGLHAAGSAAVARGTARDTIPTITGSRRTRARPAAWRRRIAGWCCAITCTSWSGRCADSQRARSAAGCGLRRRAVSGHDAASAASAWWGWTIRAKRRASRGGGSRRRRWCADAGDARRFAPGSFAGLTMFHVLEHLYDPRAYLDAARRAAGDGWPADGAGAECGLAGNSGCWGAVERRWTCRATCSIFAIAMWRSCWRRCGFEVLRRKYFSLRDNPAGLASSLAPALDPMARRVRRVAESGGARLVKDSAYFALVVASVPFTLLEAAFRAGSTVMIEARRRDELHRASRIGCRAGCGGIFCISRWRSRTRWRPSRARLPDGARVLDAGAGEGQYRAPLRAPALLRRGSGGGRRGLGLQPARCGGRPDCAAFPRRRVRCRASTS